MVPEIIRLERAAVCGCGELVAAGERAGYAAPQGDVVVCLACVGQLSAATDADEAARRVKVLVPAEWTAGEEVIAATLRALREEPVPAASSFSESSLLHVPAEWSAPTQVTTAQVDREVLSDPLPDAAAAPASTTPVATAAESQTAVAVAARAGQSRHAATTVVDARMPVPAQRRRANLFTRMLTVRSLRAQHGRAKGAGDSDVMVGALLDAAAARGVLTLHDRRIPGCRGRLEHIAVGPSGIYVIDVKHFKNASIEVRPAGDAQSGTDDLVVGKRVMTAAVVATRRRVAELRSLLATADLTDVPVVGALCFVDGLLPLSVGDLEVGGVHVMRPSGLTALVATPGSLDGDHRRLLQQFLAQQLPAST